MKTFDKREITTILVALRYLQANRNDALEAMSDFDDAAGTETKPFLMTEKEIDALCEKINLEVPHGRPELQLLLMAQRLTKPAMMTIYVAYLRGKVKGILTAKEYERNSIAYWDELKTVEVPIDDWNAEKVTVATIQNYL